MATLSYDILVDAFLSKITEFEFIQLPDDNRIEITDEYRKRAVSAFRQICVYDLSLCDDEVREYTDDFLEDDLDEIIEIISEGMVVQWLKPYLYRQELLESIMNTRDYSTYSSANLLMRVGEAYKQARRDYTNMTRQYSYNHGDLTVLHL